MMTQQPLIMDVAQRTICRDCGVTFEDLSGHRLCDACLADHINGAGELELDDDDDLFPDTPRQQPPTARITCRVCGARAEVPMRHPALLCPACLADVPATRSRVQAWLDAALAQLVSNDTQWAEVSADTRWQPVQRALEAVADGTMPQAQLDRTWATRTAEGGALAQLLGCYEAYVRECDRLQAELARLDGAMREIETAEVAQ